ncbi:MAG: T9SS type A sorting domain-containing protein [Bacteroidaceae bacterium]|nr:T9SS type A sorting domain-containing protein [Bacteroidaceae bacterium]
MKKLIIFFTFALLTIPAMSQSQITIEKVSGDTQTMLWKNFRKITFDGNKVNILSDKGESISNQMADILRITTTITETGVENVTDNGRLLNFVSSDDISVNCPAGEIIAIYNLSGCIVLSQRALSNNGCINIAHLPNGVYMLQANCRTVKFLKR